MKQPREASMRIRVGNGSFVMVRRSFALLLLDDDDDDDVMDRSKQDKGGNGRRGTGIQTKERHCEVRSSVPRWKRGFLHERYVIMCLMPLPPVYI